jgi:hypothetical protein
MKTFFVESDSSDEFFDGPASAMCRKTKQETNKLAVTSERQTFKNLSLLPLHIEQWFSTKLP